MISVRLETGTRRCARAGGSGLRTKNTTVSNLLSLHAAKRAGELGLSDCTAFFHRTPVPIAWPNLAPGMAWRPSGSSSSSSDFGRRRAKTLRLASRVSQCGADVELVAATAERACSCTRRPRRIHAMRNLARAAWAVNGMGRRSYFDGFRAGAVRGREKLVGEAAGEGEAHPWVMSMTISGARAEPRGGPAPPHPALRLVCQPSVCCF